MSINDYAPDENVLPGLEPPTRSASPLEVATRRTITRLHELGLVDESHAMLTRLLVDLAEVVDAGRRQGKASAAAMAAAQILATYQILVPVDSGEGGEDDPFDELAGELRDAAAAARRDLAG